MISFAGMTTELEQSVHPHPPEALAKFKGQLMMELPRDLYIPPDALELFLEAFEGPMDLLLYLIKKQNLDILDMPIAEITRQYMQYVELMHAMQFELAAEYLLMAAMLAEIKSRMLLPRPAAVVAEEEDPRAELIRRLQEYERIKKAAEDIEALPRAERDFYVANAQAPEIKINKPLPTVALKDLIAAFQEVYQRAKLNAHHQVRKETLSVRERMSVILDRINTRNFAVFVELFNIEEGRMGVVVTFIAILELLRQTLIELVQTEPLAPIHVKGVSATADV